MSDTVGEGLSLARPGSGDNEDRPLAHLRRRLLLRIQVIQPGKFRCDTFVKIGHEDSIAESPGLWQGVPLIVPIVSKINL